ncbi:CBS domain-containing protein [Alsobacter sp. KACC 23698]|uniref:CBS domain-containing protein n=1 Tax=Alsobacter sp. KACC 23698 TaxID=3149229 RepID=A0AAU7JI05_9HYPH
MLIGQIVPEIRERLAAVHEKDNLMKAGRLLLLDHINAVVVFDNEEKVVGILTDSDIIRAVADADKTKCIRGQFQCEISVDSAMTKNVVTCRPEDFLEHVWGKMSALHLRHLPVLDGEGRAIGILCAKDALTYLRREAEYEARYLVEYVSGLCG